MKPKLHNLHQSGANDQDVVTWDDSLSKWIPQPVGDPEPPLEVQAFQDKFDITGAPIDEHGPFTLTYLPMENSEHVYWHPNGDDGIYLEGAKWGRVDWYLTLFDDAEFYTDDDFITVEYLHFGEEAPPEPPDPPDPPEELPTLIIPDNEVELSTVSSLSQAGSAVVGAAPQWGDNDAGTYAKLNSRYGTGTGNRYQHSFSNIDAQPGLVVDADARIAIWWKEISNDHAGGMSSRLSQYSGSGNKMASSPTGANGLTAPVGWNVCELIPTGTNTIASVMTFWQTNNLYVQMNPGAVSPDPPGTFFSTIDVSEVRIAIYYPEP